jgi:hypothetical protein
MNRRTFLELATAAGAGAIGTQTRTNAQAEAFHPLPMELHGVNSTQVLLRLENEHLSLTLYNDASADIVDRTGGSGWHMGPVALQEESEIDVGHVWLRGERSVCEQFPGRFIGRKEGDNLRFWLLGREHQPLGSFLVRVTLDRLWLDYRLLQIDEILPSLSFPPAIESESLVLPTGVGRWIRKPEESRLLYTFPSSLNMRWVGGLRAKHGWLAVFPEKNYVDTVALVTGLSVAPIWLKSLDQWTEPRAVRFRFVQGDYVALAKCYREWAKSQGLHTTLEDKAKTNPAISAITQGRLISVRQANCWPSKSNQEDRLEPQPVDHGGKSGVDVRFTHEQVRQLRQEMPAAGIDTALLILRGWMNGGYDYPHPDVWPPEPELGSLDEFRLICASSPEFPVALHDNYQDIYRHSKSWPHGVIHGRNGKPMAGGFWEPGQAYILNARSGLGYAKRNWSYLGRLRLRALFLDTTTAVQMYQSREAGNRLTRAEDLEAKRSLFRFFHSQGLVLGSEEGADWGVPFLGWNENRHAYQAGQSVPLWPLVFHDAVVSARYAAEPGANFLSCETNSEYPEWLPDMLWGYALLSDFKSFPDRTKQIEQIRSTRHVDDWFHTIATAEMVAHSYLTSEGTLEKTEFSTGHAILVNFSPDERSHDGLRVAGHGYVIVKPQA